MRILKLIFFVLNIFVGITAVAQSFANDWIDHSKKYVKISDARTGIFKLSYDQLLSAGFNVGDDPRTFQLIRRGKPVSIKVVGESDGVFDHNDYILYYGQKLDGIVDSVLYLEGVDVVNPYYNLYSDSTAYYLTAGVAGPARITAQSETLSTLQIYLEKERVNVYSNNYALGKIHATYIFKSEFDYAEGWMSSPKGNGKLHDWQGGDFSDAIDIDGYDYGLEVRLAGRNSNAQNIEVTLGNRTFSLNGFEGFQTSTQNISWGFDDLSDGKLQVKAYTRGSGNVSTAYEKYKYPVSTNLRGVDRYSFSSFADNTKSVLVDIEGGEFWDVSKPFDPELLFAKDSAGLKKIILPPTAMNGSYEYVNDNGYLFPSKVESINFEVFTGLTNPDYLIVYHSSLKSQAEQLKNYRESFAGGSHSVFMVEQQSLIESFHYGERSPLATRNFVKSMLNQYNPKYLVLFGNGAAISLSVATVGYLRKAPLDQQNKYGVGDLVMTYGAPGSDIMFSNKIIDANDLVPSLATGRIPCYNAEEAQNYIDKIIEYESTYTAGLDRKRVLHLAGGTNPSEINTFERFLSDLAVTINSSFYGGEVKNYSKKTDETVEFINISKEVNQGVGLVTFFGHSNFNSADIDVGLVSDEINGYQNKGKYPVLWINGCRSTDVYNGYLGVRTRDWLFTKDKGAIGAFGHASYGYTFTLSEYSSLFYNYAFQDSLFSTKAVGEIQRKVISEFIDGKESSVYHSTQASQFNFLGDPAFKFIPQNAPDYEIKSESVSIQSLDGGEVLANTDTIAISFTVDNYGRVSTDSVEVCIERIFLEDTLSYPVQKIPTVSFRDKFTLNISSEGFEGEGENVFVISLNCSGQVAETDYSNNKYEFTRFLRKRGLSLLYPYEFSVLSNNSIQFVIENRFPQSEGDLLEFELSLSPSFEDFVVQDFVTSEKLAQYEFIIPDLDSTTYYWRVKPSSQDDTIWENSSFTYLRGNSIEGWGQMEFDQFYDVGLDRIEKDSMLSLWKFKRFSSKVVANIAGKSVSGFTDLTNLIVNGQFVAKYTSGGCGEGIWVLPFDAATSLPYNLDGIGGGGCGQRPQIIEKFRLNYNNNLTKEESEKEIIDYLDRIPQDDPVLIMGVGNYRALSWSDDLKAKLKEFGAKLIDSISSNDYPFILLGRRGEINPIYEELGESRSSTVGFNLDLIGNESYGTIKSPIIGPAKSWGTYNHSLDIDDVDSVQIAIYGISSDRSETLLYSTKNQQHVELDLELDLGILASEYPRIYFKAFLKDSINRNVAQIKNWSIQYDKVPEGVLILDDSLTTDLYIGDNIALPFTFKNVTPYSFDDSIHVDVEVSNLTAGKKKVFSKIAPLNGFELVTSSINLSSDSLSGENRVSLFVNNGYQEEQSLLNNFTYQQYDISPDVTAPATDVTFDGIRIKSGDIVSPSPLIITEVFDDNLKLQKIDTADVFVFLKYPCDSCDYQRLYFKDALELVKEDGGYTVELQLNDLQNGTYSFKISTSDYFGNISSVTPYEISFKVVNAKNISNMIFAPNPLINGSSLSFYLSGDEVPNDINVNIYSSEGSLVQVITLDDIGTIHVGQNLTEYKWDGRSLNGELLPNGVYHYRVEYDLSGTGIEYLDSDDQFREPGIGKILILR